MKFYQSPLNIASTFLFVYSLYLLTDKGSGTMGFGMFLAIPMLICTVLGILLHFIFLQLFSTNKRLHFIVELAFAAFFVIGILLINR